MSIRPVKRSIKAKPTIEGAGVRLRRAFGFGDTTEFDPFLLLDDFRNERPEDYLAGFPWHPHRGIETITYVLAGNVDHGDSLGNRGTIGAGDVQWMTAGSGIIHQEMPHGDPGGPDARLPAVGEPAGVAEDDLAPLPGRRRARHPRSDRRRWDAGACHLRQLLGSDRAGGRDRRRASVPGCPVPPGQRRSLPVETTRHAFAYVFAGSGELLQRVAAARGADRRRGWARHGVAETVENRSLVVFDRGDEVTVQAGESGVRFLLVSGKPLREPVAWYGPIVMNTREQLQQAFAEYQAGTFLKHR